MRIESYSQIQQLYNASKPANNKSTATSLDFKDKLNISSAGKDLTIAKQAVNSAPDVRADKIEAVKSAIDNGTYDVSGQEFADKIMEKLSQAFA